MTEWRAGDFVWEVKLDQKGIPRSVEAVKLTESDASGGMLPSWIYPEREAAVAEMRRRLAIVESELAGELDRIRKLMDAN